MKTWVLHEMLSNCTIPQLLESSNQHPESSQSALIELMWRIARLSLLPPSMVLGLLLVIQPTALAQLLQPGEVLRPGSSGFQVTELQRALNNTGIFVTIDGEYGPATEAAVQQFQINRGLASVDGIYGAETDRALFGNQVFSTGVPVSSQLFGPYANVPAGSRIITLGDRGSDVLELQRLLNRRGFNAGSEDGTFGNATVSAVRLFQSSRGLSVDGSVGPATWCELGVCTAGGNPPAGTGNMTPLETILNRGRYVVVVPGSDTSKLFTIQNELGRPAYLTRSDRGSFLTPGGYPNYREARNDALRLRGANLDARVEYFD